MAFGSPVLLAILAPRIEMKVAVESPIPPRVSIEIGSKQKLSLSDAYATRFSASTAVATAEDSRLAGNSTPRRSKRVGAGYIPSQRLTAAPGRRRNTVGLDVSMHRQTTRL